MESQTRPFAARLAPVRAPHSLLLLITLVAPSAGVLSGCGDSAKSSPPTVQSGRIAAPAAAPGGGNASNAAEAPSPVPATIATNTSESASGSRVDPFANVDANSSDVLKRILSVDEKARTNQRKGAAAAPGVQAAPAATAVTNTASPAATLAAPAAAPAAATGNSSAPVPGQASNAARIESAAARDGGAPPVPAPVSGAPASPVVTLSSVPASSIAAAPPAPVPPAAGSTAATPSQQLALAAAPASTSRSADASQQLRAISRPDPEFPREALREGVLSGRVLATLAIGTDGRVSAVRIVESQPAKVFDLAARRALMSWRFEPLREPVTAQIELLFRSE